jgi:hypothetical protein
MYRVMVIRTTKGHGLRKVKFGGPGPPVAASS